MITEESETKKGNKKRTTLSFVCPQGIQ